MKAFSSFELSTGVIAALDRKFPSYLSGLKATDHGDALMLAEGGTHYGYITEGEATLKSVVGLPEVRLPKGAYFCNPGAGIVEEASHDCEVVVVSRETYMGVYSVGGPAEHTGRLRYIDGCTDSLLIPPVMLGDPCLNLLYFPEGIDQTAHTHPSDRIGVIMSGRGTCHFENDGVWDEVELREGMLFCIHTDGLHKFSTLDGSDMRVLAYHPDSDFGPTHEVHPMLNRTLVDGVSARFIDAIRTKG